MKNVIELFRNKNGIEIGGLSRIFQEGDQIPIYPVINNLDGCNFTSQTLWESGLTEGQNYDFYHGKIGYQYICEATELADRIEENKYDFVISSNCLEHSANPLKALWNFIKVLKPMGEMMIVVPNKEVTFDHNRNRTSFEHLKDDFINDVKEDDLTHLDEILELHDLAMDPPAGTKEQFRIRSLDNYHNRGLHQHVFDSILLFDMFKWLNLDTIYLNNIGSDYVIVGRK